MALRKYIMEFTDVHGIDYRVVIDEDRTGIPYKYNCQSDQIRYGLPGAPNTKYILTLSFSAPSDCTKVEYITWAGVFQTWLPPFSVPDIYESTLPYATGQGDYFRFYRPGGNEDVYPWPDTEEPIPVVLTGSAQPVVIKSVNNDDDILTPIRARECVIEILNINGAVTIETFAGDDNIDTIWRTTAQKYNGGWQDIFNGFLTIDDLTEPLQDPVNTIKLIATDRIGSLKNIPITTPTEGDPNSVETLLNVINWCLKKTGLALDIYVADNTTTVKEGNDYQALAVALIDTKMFFSKGDNTNCYDVLEQLLGGGYYLTQRGGAWWIVHHASISTNIPMVRLYNNVTLLPAVKSLPPTKQITQGGSSFFINANAYSVLIRPLGVAEVKYSFKERSSELMNGDYSRGLYINNETLPSNGYYWMTAEQFQGHSLDDYIFSTYNLDDWALHLVSGSGSFSAPDITSYIRRYFLQGDETDREMVIDKPSDWTKNYALENGASIQVEAGDRMLLSFEWRAPKPLCEVKANRVLSVAQVVLKGQSGKNYTLKSNFSGDRNKWYQEADGTAATQYLKAYFDYVSGSGGGQMIGNKTWFATGNGVKQNGEGGGEYTDEFPENGVLKIRFVLRPGEWYDNGDHASFGAQYLFRNINLEIKRFINGSVVGSSGQYNRITKPLLSAKRVIDISIDNSPKRSYEGSILEIDDSVASGIAYKSSGLFNNPLLGSTACTWGTLVALGLRRLLMRMRRTVRGDIMMGTVEEPETVANYYIGDDATKTYNLLAYEWNVKDAMMTNVTMQENTPVGVPVEDDNVKIESGFKND